MENNDALNDKNRLETKIQLTGYNYKIFVYLFPEKGTNIQTRYNICFRIFPYFSRLSSEIYKYTIIFYKDEK